MLTSEEIKVLVNSGEGYNVDFKLRVPSKVRELSEEVCAFANAAGGYLLIGVTDKNEIVGNAIDNSKRSAIQDSIRDISPAVHTSIYSVEVDGKIVWVIDVPSGKNKPYVLSGAIYVREGANSQKLTKVEEMRDFFQQSDRIYFDATPCPKFDIRTQIDDSNFKSFRDESRLNESISNEQILENLQVFDDNGVIKRGGVLFFAKHPEDLFFQAIVRCVLFKGTTKVHIIDDKTFGGPLYLQYQQAMAWVQSKLQVAYLIEGAGPRKEIWEIPLTVFKEAIINALSHRDYYEQGASITIEMFDNRVEVSNPGGLLMSVKKDFGHKSMSRNPLIFGLFTRMHLVERIASGIPRMREAMKEAKLPKPIFHTDGMFTVIFERPNQELVLTEANTTKALSKNQLAIILLMKENSHITLTEIENTLDLSKTTVYKNIKHLREHGYIDRSGSDKTGNWVILVSEL